VKLVAKYWIYFLLIFLLAMALRLPRLAQRPMHTDEAVQALKFGSLLEEGDYRYDFHEYHGPTLNYLTLFPAWLSFSFQLTDIDEFTLRLVPVIFGLLLLLLLLLLKDVLGWPALLLAALFTAISPTMVYYSRYYIMEILLVCFTFGAIVAGLHLLQTHRLKWAILTGLFLGLMHATKETWIIALGAIAGALLFRLWQQRTQTGSWWTPLTAFPKKQGLWLIGVALLVSALFYSSFLTHPAGIADAFRCYLTYFQRAGQNSIHEHPWYYYLKLLLFYRVADGPVWSEGFLLLLAGIGALAVFTKKETASLNRAFIQFLVVFTGLMILIYSLIPYKTPWCLLGFWHGVILLAGVGAALLIRRVQKFYGRIVVLLLLLVGSGHLFWQAYLANFQYAASPKNPYVYAHTSLDIFKIVDRLQAITGSVAAGKNLYIEVICPGDDYWPLPWYFRNYPNVGWWHSVDLETPPAPVIIISPAVEADLIHKLYFTPPPGERNLYLRLFDDYVELRPGVELRGYIVKDLWEEFQESSEFKL